VRVRSAWACSAYASLRAAAPTLAALTHAAHTGTCVAVAGESYCIVAADTRMSTGFSILTRDCKKIVELCAPARPDT